jgi:putative tricarboxylic transport membrane protein
VQKTDRWLGLALALLAGAVLWSARAFPDVPGQKVGAGFLPMLVGVGLLLCGLGLVVRSWRAAAYEGEQPVEQDGGEHFGSSLVVIGVIVFYILAADRLGFLIAAPLCLVAVFKALRVRTGPALLWAAVGTVVVHVAFYKLLRVPLPWGVLRPFY